MDAKLQIAFDKGRSWFVRVSNNDVYKLNSYPLMSVDIVNEHAHVISGSLMGSFVHMLYLQYERMAGV